MPHYAGASVARLASVLASSPIRARGLTHHIALAHAAGAYCFLYCGVHGMKLMIACDDLIYMGAVCVLFEDNEMLK